MALLNGAPETAEAIWPEVMRQRAMLASYLQMANALQLLGQNARC